MVGSIQQIIGGNNGKFYNRVCDRFFNCNHIIKELKMKEVLKIRKAKNGYILNVEPQYRDGTVAIELKEYVAETKQKMQKLAYELLETKELK